MQNLTNLLLLMPVLHSLKILPGRRFFPDDRRLILSNEINSGMTLMLTSIAADRLVPKLLWADRQTDRTSYKLLFSRRI
jgi:hypothetical protein